MEETQGSVMNDGQRKYPVNIFVLHHSAGPDFADTDDLTIQDWYSETGKARGYNNGAINPMHGHPGRPGQLSYAMAQFAGAPDSSNKYNYRLIDLITDPWHNVTWSVGNWDINVVSCSIENCGNFLYKTLENRQLMCIADYLRPIDQELGGTLQILLHSEIFATACPGRLKEQRDTLVDMINRPEHWNAVLWPATLEPEVPTPTEPVGGVKIEPPLAPEPVKVTNPLPLETPPVVPETPIKVEIPSSLPKEEKEVYVMTEKEFNKMVKDTEYAEVDGWKPTIPDTYRLVAYLLSGIGTPVVAMIYQMLAVYGVVTADLAVQVIAIIGTCLGSIAGLLGVSHFRRGK